MSDTEQEFDDLISQLSTRSPLGARLSAELTKLGGLLLVDAEMAVVRSRRVVDILLREIYSRRVGVAGTRPLDDLLKPLEHDGTIPRGVGAHIRSLRELANICAHDGSVDPEGLTACLANVRAILGWFIKVGVAAEEPSFRIVDGAALSPAFDEIERILEIDTAVYGRLDEASLGSATRSRTWFSRNPQIYTLLKSHDALVGYANVIPLENEAFDEVLKGRLQDGLITSDMIRSYEMPGNYRAYVCSLAILPEARRHAAAFRTLYNGILDKLIDLADHDIVMSEIACNAWTPEGRSLARTFGMRAVVGHQVNGEIHHCTLIPSNVNNPGSKVRRLLEKYRPAESSLRSAERGVRPD